MDLKVTCKAINFQEKIWEEISSTQVRPKFFQVTAKIKYFFKKKLNFVKNKNLCPKKDPIKKDGKTRCRQKIFAT